MALLVLALDVSLLGINNYFSAAANDYFDDQLDCRNVAQFINKSLTWDKHTLFLKHLKHNIVKCLSDNLLMRHIYR